MNTIQEGWESFRQKVIPDASQVQTEEMEKAFYAGASHILMLMWNVGDKEFSEDAGVNILENLHQEYEQFFKRIIK